MQWLKSENKATADILFRDCGKILESDFSKTVANTFLFYPRFYYSQNIVIKILYRFYRARLFNKLKKQNYSAIYSNTMVNGAVLSFLKPLNIPIVSHIREMESTINHFGGLAAITKINNLSAQIIAVSNAVKNQLISQYAFPENKITVINEYVKTPDISQKKDYRLTARKELNISESTFVIGACGGVDWRKGYDFFLYLAINYCYEFPKEDINFVWIGRVDKQEEYRLQYDIKKAGLENTVKFVGVKPESWKYFAAFDAFFLASREEPGGLVSLEAGAWEMPVICFENAGGVDEFIEKDAGFVIRYLDIEAAITKVQILKNDALISANFGKKAREKMLLNHSIEIASAKIFNVINSVIKK